MVSYSESVVFYGVLLVCMVRCLKVSGNSLSCAFYGKCGRKMAESRMVFVVPLNGSNYATWKVQCKMALIKEGLWKIVEGGDCSRCGC